MKSIPLLALICNCARLCAITVGTNDIGIVLADPSLSAAQQASISNDVERLFAPAASNLTIRTDYIPSGAVGYLDAPRLPAHMHGGKYPSAIVSMDGALRLRVDTDVSGIYTSNEAFFIAHSNQIAQAADFANLLVTNSVASLPSSTLKSLFLSKEFAPGALPDNKVQQIRDEFGQGVYYLPSLLSYREEPEGPTGASSYLWGAIPWVSDQTMINLPIIYYQNRWWISVWHMEGGEQTWE